MGPKILLLEDDVAERKFLRDALREENMYVEAVGDFGQVLGRYLGGGDLGFELLLLDADLGGHDGFSICRELRTKVSVPIVMLSDRSDETSVVVGLEIGADDYVTKPFSLRVLTSRLRAHLRRQRRNAVRPIGEVLRFPGLEIDLPKCQALAQGAAVDLTAVQFKILTLLAAHPGAIYSREQILARIWGNGLPSGSRAADAHIQNIRQKIEPDLGSGFK